MGSGIKLKKLELIHIRAARLIHKLPKCMKDDDTLARVSRICLFHYAPYHTNIAGDLGLINIIFSLSRNHNLFLVIIL